jgi:nitrogen fixation-related uncharacterized protein
MFIPLWLVYLFSGTIMAVLTLLWAVRGRQFEDQDRARFIPLTNLTPAEMAAPARRAPTSARIAIFGIIVLGIGTLLWTLLVVVRA